VLTFLFVFTLMVELDSVFIFDSVYAFDSVFDSSVFESVFTFDSVFDSDFDSVFIFDSVFVLALLLQGVDKIEDEFTSSLELARVSSTPFHP
jgi:hypothetical protein